MALNERYLVGTADEDQLNELAAGRPAPMAVEWGLRDPEDVSNRQGKFTVLWKQNASSDLAQPLAVICRLEDQRRLFGRFSQLRSDFSPVSSWCHIFSPARFAMVTSLTRRPDLNGWEASWSALAIAEALLLAERSIAKLRLPACQATQTFALARAVGLWGAQARLESIAAFETIRRILRQRDQGQNRVRLELDPIWSSLTAVSDATLQHLDEHELHPIVNSLHRFRAARECNPGSEALTLAHNLQDIVPEASILAKLEGLTPEERLMHFDGLIGTLDRERPENVTRRCALSMLAGYISTVAAGGIASLSLAEGLAGRWPAITAWAYILGSIGEKVVWTSGFDGLGRLVARELARPLHLDEAPTCDFGIEEALALVDPKLSDPYVHLRIKQARFVAVALLPGVNITVPINEGSQADARRLEYPTMVARAAGGRVSEPGDDQVAVLADAIWPHLQPRVQRVLESDAERRDQQKKRRRKNPSPKEQPKLWPRD